MRVVEVTGDDLGGAPADAWDRLQQPHAGIGGAEGVEPALGLGEQAEDLLKAQYGAVGAAARHALPAAVSALGQAAAAGLDVAELTERTRARAANAEAFTAAYRRYCWPTNGLDGIRFVPFQLLGTEGTSYSDRPHAWHLAIAVCACVGVGIGAGMAFLSGTTLLYSDVTDDVRGRVFAFIPGADWALTMVYEIPREGPPRPAFDIEGWSYSLIKVR